MRWNDWNLIAFGFVMGGVSGGVLEAALPFISKALVGSDGRVQWETLLAGIAAVVAAAFTVGKLRQRMEQIFGPLIGSYLLLKFLFARLRRCAQTSANPSPPTAT
jgi:hypothetical protein